MRNKTHLLAALCLGFLWAMTRPCAAEQLPVRTYTSADGLGSSFVNSIMRDSRGFLWVCTRDGLSRFDGSRFVTYQVGDRTGSPGIEQLLETRKGIYWVVTTSGLYRFDPAIATSETGSQDRRILNAEFVSSARGVLYENHNGDLWFGSNGLYRLQEEDKKVSFHKVELNLPPNPLIGFGIAAMCEGQDQSLWLVTSWGLVRRLPNGKEVFYGIDEPLTNSLTSTLADRNGRIWVGRVNGLYAIKPETPDELPAPGNVMLRKLSEVAKADLSGQAHVDLPERSGEILLYRVAENLARGYTKFLYQTADGHIWISNGEGLIEFDGNLFHTYTAAQGFVQGPGEMVEDESGNLWLGGANSLLRLDRGGLTSYGTSDGLSDSSVLTINSTRDDKLYVMSRDLSVSLFDGKGFQTVHPRLDPDARVVWTSNPVLQDSAGEWWILTNEKLYRFAATNDFHNLARQRPRATYDSNNGLKGDQIFHIFEDSHQDLWISTHGAEPGKFGLSKWSRVTEQFYTFTENEGFPPNKAPSAFAEDRNGDLWFGFYEGGLVRYTKGRFTEFISSDGLPDGLITAMHLDRQGRLWIGSAQSGLTHIDDPSAAHPRFLYYTLEDGLASNNVRSITEDLYGNIYAGTARGIDRLSPDVSRIRHFSINDGLTGDFVTTAFRDTLGALWFGTTNGLSRLIPTPDNAQAAPPVWVSGLRIAGEPRPVAELGTTEIPELQIATAQNNLQIDFFGIDFSAGESLRYQFRLEGADHDWSAPTLQRVVNYANLAPGAYRFLVRAVNAGGIASAKPALVSFKILPPFWRRWWFAGLLTLTIGAAVFGLDRYRALRLRQLNAALGQSRLLGTELQKSNRALSLEYELTRILAEAVTPLAAAPRVLQAICESLGRQSRGERTALC